MPPLYSCGDIPLMYNVDLMTALMNVVPDHARHAAGDAHYRVHGLVPLHRAPVRSQDEGRTLRILQRDVKNKIHYWADEYCVCMCVY